MVFVSLDNITRFVALDTIYQDGVHVVLMSLSQYHIVCCIGPYMSRRCVAVSAGVGAFRSLFGSRSLSTGLKERAPLRSLTSTLPGHLWGRSFSLPSFKKGLVQGPHLSGCHKGKSIWFKLKSNVSTHTAFVSPLPVWSKEKYSCQISVPGVPAPQLCCRDKCSAQAKRVFG